MLPDFYASAMIDAGLDSRLAGGIFFSVRSANGAMRYIAQTMPLVSTESSILVSKLTSSPGLFLHSFQSPHGLISWNIDIRCLVIFGV